MTGALPEAWLRHVARLAAVEAFRLLANARQRSPKLVRGNGSGDHGPMELLTLDEVAGLAKTSRRTVNRLVRTGALPVVLLTPQQPRVQPEDWERFRTGLPHGGLEDSHTADGGMLAPLRPAATGGVEQRAGLAGGSGSAHPAGPAHNEGEAA